MFQNYKWKLNTLAQNLIFNLHSTDMSKFAQILLKVNKNMLSVFLVWSFIEKIFILIFEINTNKFNWPKIALKIIRSDFTSNNNKNIFKIIILIFSLRLLRLIYYNKDNKIKRHIWEILTVLLSVPNIRVKNKWIDFYWKFNNNIYPFFWFLLKFLFFYPHIYVLPKMRIKKLRLSVEWRLNYDFLILTNFAESLICIFRLNFNLNKIKCHSKTNFSLKNLTNHSI